ncbi:hypothetical protein R4Z10_19615 [Niallia sp. XMNu-256]|uniref:hypothetical protein n=1 Tax=Niallia sp. XMNu-256 TaxID=3082444 RepID=UPI0030CAA4B4
MNELLGAIYWDSIHLSVSSKYSSLENFRAGSVFINFNNYGQFIVFFLGVVLSLKLNEKINLKLFSVLLLTILVSLILTGSRTGFLVASILLVLSMIIQISRKGLKRRGFTLFISILPIIILCVVVIFGKLGFSDLRLFDVSSGLNNSLEYKYTTFLDIIKNSNILNFFIGLGPYNYQIIESAQTDFDLGYMLLFYGLMGFVFYTLMIYFFYKSNINQDRNYKLFLIVAFVLTSLTAGLFFNLRVYAILLLLLYSRIEYMSKKKR